MNEYRLYLYAVDPTHIGSGGYRIGRVDKTVLRDAATNLPKIPATSLSGVVRTAAIYVLPDPGDRSNAAKYARATIDAPNDLRPHAGDKDPVAKYFGYAEGEKGTSRIGMVSFRDAHILAFPVPTMLGPRWITTAEILSAAGCAVKGPDDIAQVKIQDGGGHTQPSRINLGSYLLDAQPVEIPFPTDVSNKDLPGIDFVTKRLVLIHGDLFSSLVNANLETRTSVSIDFETGAAARKLLFTVEATPRGTLFLGRLAIDDDRFPELGVPALELLQMALRLACRWGLGGMTTRGFGRMRPLLIREG